MAEVRIGDIKVGSVQQVSDEWYAFRVGPDGRDVRVGLGPDKRAAINKLALSLVAKSRTEGTLTPLQQEKLRELLNQLNFMGAGGVAAAILEVLK